jgi:hypothetical protein
MGSDHPPANSQNHASDPPYACPQTKGDPLRKSAQEGHGHAVAEKLQAMSEGRRSHGDPFRKKGPGT